MNHTSANNRRARLLAIGLALSASTATPFGTLPAGAAEEKKDSAGFVDKMKQWQDRMSDKFRDTWEGWRGKKGGQSVGVASIDLREQKDSYTVRLNMPERDLDKVDIKLEGDSLHIAAPAEKKAGGYEQTITLSNVAHDAKLEIERKQKDSLIVVTVPKGATSSETSPSLTLPDPSLLPLGDWDRDIFARMDKMRREMDRIFDESFKEFRSEHKGVFDRPRFGSSLDVQEEGDNYVVRAYLPDRKMENVNVTVEGQTLKIEAKAEETEKKEDKGVVKSHKAHYAQVITLPGPVKDDKMKVDKKEGMIVVTLPKA
jgi:HSP20 family molecular chaperone IbpA